MTAFTHDAFFAKRLAEADPDVFGGIQGELRRQQEQIELIASENIVSRAVLEAQGSVLTNKYAEGYPGRRYYGGCEYVDVTENLARERAKQLFNCAFANVQPHSGAQANQAVFMSLLQPGDTFLGMDLACGGHLTHGSPANQSGKWFRPVTYKVTEDTHLIDYDHVAEMAEREKPKLILADEIEAVTEPGAAARIIASILSYLGEDKGVLMSVVTHLGVDLMAHAPEDARIDGIEAKGLDDDLNLIVDRNPKIGHLATSTPELIIERLARKEDNGLYSAIHHDLARTAEKKSKKIK